jgi:sugar-specific transcriptional regulator TrmB
LSKKNLKFAKYCKKYLQNKEFCDKIKNVGKINIYIKNMQIIQQLKKLGLSEKQAEIYIAGLEIGQATILQIADKSKIKRGTVYELIDEMVSLGLFKKSIKGKKIFYIASDPNILKILQNERTETLYSLMPMLRGLAKNTQDKPRVFFYDDLEDIRKVYLEKLSEQKTETLGLGGLNFIEKLGNEWLLKYIQKRKLLNIKSKEITNVQAKKWQERDERDLRETRILHNGKNFEIGIEIYDECVILSSLVDEDLCLVIESKIVRDAMKTMFDIIWETL